jgi:uncharacterized protein (TIGR04255 family)
VLRVNGARQPMPTTRSLQELIIAAHFDAPLPITVMDLASWVAHFGNFPLVQQLPVLPPMNLPVPGAPQIHFVAEGTLPRMFLRTTDGRHSVQLQNDRLAFGWHRTEPIGDPAEYPGFEANLADWKHALDDFEAWTQERFHQKPAHRMVEISYSNAVPIERDGGKKKLSEIFKFVQLGGRKINGFNASWAESIYPVADMQPPKGVVGCMVGLGIAPPALPVLAFTFTGSASIAPGEHSEHILSDIHAKIREIYESAIIPDAD